MTEEDVGFSDDYVPIISVQRMQSCLQKYAPGNVRISNSVVLSTDATSKLFYLLLIIPPPTRSVSGGILAILQ